MLLNIVMAIFALLLVAGGGLLDRAPMASAVFITFGAIGLGVTTAMCRTLGLQWFTPPEGAVGMDTADLELLIYDEAPEAPMPVYARVNGRIVRIASAFICRYNGSPAFVVEAAETPRSAQ